MLYTQKYHSLSDIDLEFIPSLESLLSENIPSFEWMKEAEKEIPEEIHFTYFLFFGNRHNSPVGFARLELEKVPVKKRSSFFANFFSKKYEAPHKLAHWKMNCSFGEGLTFDPLYLRPGIETANKILVEYQKREDIRKQSLTFYQAYSELENNLIKIKDRQEKIIAHALVKSKASYQQYLQDLNEETFKRVMGLWKKANKSYTLGEFQSFKEIFEYRQDGAKLLNHFKKLSSFQKIKELSVTYLTLEKDQKIIAIVCLIKGKLGNYFYDFHELASEVDPLLYHQMALLNFFEKEDAKKLYPMSHFDSFQFFETLGFKTRKQWYIEIDHE